VAISTRGMERVDMKVVLLFSWDGVEGGVESLEGEMNVSFVCVYLDGVVVVVVVGVGGGGCSGDDGVIGVVVVVVVVVVVLVVLRNVRSDLHAFEFGAYSS
jgi:hypothetical protein